MKKRLFLIILLLLIPLGGYLWHHQQPEQQIGRTIEQFFEHVEHRKVSIRQPDDVSTAFQESLADKIIFQGASPIPDEELTVKEAINRVGQLHALTTLVEITEMSRTLKVIGSKAQAYLSIKILAAAGKNYKIEQAWELVFDLEESDKWRITGIRGREN